MINKTLYRAYRLRHEGPEWPLWEAAWNKYPTLKKDCETEKTFKALAREGVVSKLRKLQAQ